MTRARACQCSLRLPSTELAWGLTAGSCGRLDANDDVFPSGLLYDLEIDLLTGLQRPQQCRIPGTEIHGHRRPVEAGNRIVSNRYRRMRPVHRFDAALRHDDS